MEIVTKYDKFKQFCLIVAGNFLIAFAVTFFVLPNNILTGGVAGVSVALQPLIPIDPVWMVNILTIGLFIVGAIFLGKDLAIKTFMSAIISPIFITILSMLQGRLPESYFLMNDLLATIYTGVFLGLGLGIVFRANASTGGMDIPALMLTKYFHIKSGVSVMIVDGLTVALGVITYGLVPVLTGIISVIICGKTINYIVTATAEPALEVQIISDKKETIQEYILNTIDRGITVLEGYGAYTKIKKEILVCVITQKQFPMLETEIQNIDPKAFFIVKDVKQVSGEGFNLP